MEYAQNRVIRAILLAFISVMALDFFQRSSISSKISPDVPRPAAAAADLPQIVERVNAQGHTLRVLICGGCGGYTQHLEDLKGYLASEFANLQIVSAPYPVKSAYLFASRFLTALQYSSIVLISFGDKLCNALGLPSPVLVQRLRDKGWMFILASIFILRNVASALENTGAFEVSLDDVPLFSKLATGVFPDARQIAAQIKAYLIAA